MENLISLVNKLQRTCTALATTASRAPFPRSGTRSRPSPSSEARFFHRARNVATITQVKGDDSRKPYTCLHNYHANFIIYSQDSRYSGITHGMKCIETTGTISHVSGDERGDKDAHRTTSEFICVNRDTLGQTVKCTVCEEDQMSTIEDNRGKLVSDDEEISEDDGYPVNVLPKSRHRDGSIYRGMDMWWKMQYCIADRRETRLEAMMFSDPSPTDYIVRNGIRMGHGFGRMLQFFSLELAEIAVDGGSAELYGYIAVRDDLDPLLNYIVNFSRDDPIVVEQGSLINMAGPKRAIDMFDLALIEYDMRIKTGEHEKDDLPLIDGASLVGPAGTWDRPFLFCIPGNYGTVNINLARLNAAVEATVEVLISEVHNSFSFSLGCLTSGLNKEIQLFNGAITESRGLKRSVVAVRMDRSIDLKFMVGAFSSSSEQHFCSFKAKTHGHDAQEIKTDFGLVSLKVTWSTMPRGQYVDCAGNE